MTSLASAWETILEKKYAGVENAVCAMKDSDAVFLVQNMGTVLEPLVGISLRLESSQASIEDLLVQTRGFSIEKQEFSYDGEVGYFAILKCTKKKFNQHFILFAEKLLEDVAENVKASIALKSFTQRWTEFFSKIKSKRLTDEEIIGLYGELLVLNDLVDELGGGVDVIQAWQGPLRNAWDYLVELPSTKIQFEVKTSTSSHDHVSISGLKQLLESDIVYSYLCLQKVNMTRVKVPSEQNTVIDLIDKIKTKIQADHLALSLFEELLSELAEFGDEHCSHCRLLIFQERSRQWYVIDEKFPALTSLTLPEQLRQRIRDVRYELELAGLNYEKIKLPF